MKKYLLLLLIFLPLFTLGQSNYKIELTNLTYDVRENTKNSTSSNVTITLIYEDNTTVELYYRHIGSHDKESGWNLIPPIISDKKPKMVHTTGFVNFRTGTDALYNQYNTIDICTLNTYDVNTHTPRMSYISFDIKYTPVLDGALTNPADKAFPTEDPIIIGSNYTDFSAAVYNWQFSLDLINWYSFPSTYQGKSSSSLTATELLAGSGLNVNDYIERNINIRLDPCSGTNPSSLITYTIKKSPPKITTLSIAPPQCFDTDDGKVTLSFDRALVTGESLDINLTDAISSVLVNSLKITDGELDAWHTFTIPNNLSPSKYLIKYYAVYKFTDGSGTPVTSSSNIKQSSEFTVVAPLPVSFTTTQVNVWCYDGNDGSIIINATGGTGNYQYMIKESGKPDALWTPFTNTNQVIISSLTAATWLVQVRDGSNCYAKSGAGETIISRSVTLTQPASPLQNNLVQTVNPTGYGLADGSIEIMVNGGTPDANGSYNFKWTKADGTPINAGITTNKSGNGFNIKLSNLPDGKYILSTNDNNYGSATNKNGCTAIDTYTLVQPTPLKVKIQIQDSILCKGNSNGSLVAHASGGISFNPSSPYYYSWKKQSSNGTYTLLPFETDSMATLLATGWYAVNVKDANGIVLAQDSVFFLPEPMELSVSTSQINVTCSGLPDGSANALASGGTPPYNYEWNTGETTAGINKLTAGNYLVFIKDYHQCQVQQNFIVEQPNAMTLTMASQPPLCNNYCDGKLTANLTGGILPYTYKWLGSSSINNIADKLCRGTYQLVVTDAMGCSLVHKDILTDPAPLPLNLGADRLICANQRINYDITVPGTTGIHYQWDGTDGLSSDQPLITFTQAGIYHASITDANGCNSKDTLTLTASGTYISSEFALPTQAFVNEQIIAVNTSDPLAESVKWIIPSQAIVSQNTGKSLEFSLADTGAYYLRLISYRGDCYAEQIKKIIITNRTGLNNISSIKTPFIKIFSVAPNPNSGNFTVRVTLQDKAGIQLKLINVLTNQAVSLTSQNGADSYVLPINISVVAGTYVLLLETPKGSATMRLVIL